MNVVRYMVFLVLWHAAWPAAEHAVVVGDDVVVGLRTFESVSHHMKPTLPAILALILGVLLVWLMLSWLVSVLTVPVN